MATRHKVRERVIGLLYANMFEEKKIRNKQRDFALALYNGVKDNLSAVDNKVNEFLKEWELEKVGNIERAILRLGAYELMFTELDSAVIINEAIELAKELAGDTSPKFVNGVLDSLQKSL